MKKKKGEWYGKGVQRKEWYKDKKKKNFFVRTGIKRGGTDEVEVRENMSLSMKHLSRFTMSARRVARVGDRST